MTVSVGESSLGSHNHTWRWVVAVALLAGVMDTATGLLLVSSPLLTLDLMGISSPAPETLPYLRWLGVFVGSVGLGYLYPLIFDRSRLVARLRTVFELSALLRLAVSLFVGTGILIAMLEPRRSAVAATDLLLAICQLEMLRRGWLDEERGFSR